MDGIKSLEKQHAALSAAVARHRADLATVRATRAKLIAATADSGDVAGAVLAHSALHDHEALGALVLAELERRQAAALVALCEAKVSEAEAALQTFTVEKMRPAIKRRDASLERLRLAHNRGGGGLGAIAAAEHEKIEAQYIVSGDLMPIEKELIRARDEARADLAAAREAAAPAA